MSDTYYQIWIQNNLGLMVLILMFIELNEIKAAISKMISPHCEACNPIMYLVELHFYGKNTYLTRINWL